MIRNCFHGVGFKDGAQPVLLHNTITENHIGVTLYQSATGEDAPEGTLFNNIVWGNRSWVDDSDQDVLLHGRWWPSYSQEEGNQGSLDANYNVVTGSLEGVENLAADPLLVWEEGAPVPADGSPAIDSGGNADVPTGPFTSEQIGSLLEVDYLGQARPQTDGVFDDPDRGAVEAQP